MVNSKFEGITPAQIIEASKQQPDIDFEHKRPVELLKTKYITGQEIILKGNKADYNTLINFWLSTQVWYGNEGQDYFYDRLLEDNLYSYTSWQNDPNRVGICQPAGLTEKQRYDQWISALFNVKFETEYLIMDPTWNTEKVLFIDDGNYYLYYFWSGE